MTFTKILIANRGEIACRVMRTAQRMGIRTVAVYSDPDAHAQHVQMADEAVGLGGTVAKESYLLIEKIIAACKQTGAQAVHPGYGFLSENAEFADACAKNGIVFIGPPASAIRAMGSKSAAKALMEKSKVPVVPGYHGDDQSLDLLKKTAAKIGYPVLLKAVSGGGGKGMRRVDVESELESALHGAAREAQSSFGDARVLLEKYIVNPRHIEIQLFADAHDNYVYLFERDCSIQRRHQKVIEEAPAPHITEKQRKNMGKAAVDAARAVGYVGAGTVEFIADQSGNFYFMEMNTRLQVEHPVTEMITGLDLVEWQIRVAAGEKFPITQDHLQINGHAIEVRLYAEDPERDFLPQTGTLRHLQFPDPSAHIRIDSGVRTGDTITPYYDPMIAKIIVWDHSRELAAHRMQWALAHTSVAGVATNLDFLRSLAAHPDFMAGKLTTDFIAKHRADLTYKPDLSLVPLAHLFAALAQLRGIIDHPQSGWRIGGFGESYFYFRHQDETVSVKVQFGKTLTLQIGSKKLTAADVLFDGNAIEALIDGRMMHATVILDEFQGFVVISGHTVPVRKWRFGEQATAGASDGGLVAPMPGKVVQVLVSANQNVVRGQALIILEAMKMEHTIKAPADGKVREIFYKTGEQVADGVELLAIDVTGKTA